MNEEELAFLANPRYDEAPIQQQVIPQNATYFADDLDAYDSDCDDFNTAQVSLMANISQLGSNDLNEVHNSNNESKPEDIVTINKLNAELDRVRDQVRILKAENSLNNFDKMRITIKIQTEKIEIFDEILSKKLKEKEGLNNQIEELKNKIKRIEDSHVEKEINFDKKRTTSSR